MPTWAVAVQDATGHLGLFWRIVRHPKNHVYLMHAAGQTYRREQGIPFDPHTSWHVDGRFHVKSYGRPWRRRRRQRLDAFRGADYFDATSVDQCIAARLPPCQPRNFDGLLVMAEDDLDRTPGREQLHVDLTEPGIAPLAVGGGEQLRFRWILRDAAPWIVVSLYRFPPVPPDPAIM